MRKKFEVRSAQHGTLPVRILGKTRSHLRPSLSTRWNVDSVLTSSSTCFFTWWVHLNDVGFLKVNYDPRWYAECDKTIPSLRRPRSVVSSSRRYSGLIPPCSLHFWVRCSQIAIRLQPVPAAIAHSAVFPRQPTTQTRDQPHSRIQLGLSLVISPTMTTQPPNNHSPNERKNDLQKVVLGTLHRPILDGSEADIVLKSLEYIGSYNWDKSPNPTIIVPGQSMSSFTLICPATIFIVRSRCRAIGSPRIWAGKMPLTVPLDDGTRYTDQNARRMKSFPLLPLVKAVQNTTPHFKWSPVHFVTNRGSLHAMLKWAAGRFEKWEIDTQLVGKNTILLSGCPSVTIRTGKSKHSYGSNFEKGSTTPASGLEDAPSHHRIVTYVCAFCLSFSALILNIIRISMGLKWSSASKSTLAFPMTPTQHPPPATPLLIRRSGRRIHWSSSETSRPRYFRRTF